MDAKVAAIVGRLQQLAEKESKREKQRSENSSAPPPPPLSIPHLHKARRPYVRLHLGEHS